MGFINLAEKTISAKLVYYGIGMGGKTTSLQAVHGVMCPRDEIQLVSINTEEDSTLLFDFLPINLGQVEGFKIRIQGFTVPGQPKYRMMRKFVLQGADAVVFVIDSQASRLEENLQSLEGLKENLRANGLDPETIPILLQYNKRDLDDILGEEELDRHFKWRDDLHSFPSVATDGQGVFETFVHAAGLLIEDKVRLYGLGQGEVDPQTVVDSATRKLWDIYDQVRGDVPDDYARPTMALRMTDGDDAEQPGAADAVASDEPASDAEDGAPAAADDHGELFRDEDLDLEINIDPEQLDTPLAVDAGGDPVVPVDEDMRGLLDKVVRSNVEMAQRYGELDEYKSLLERKNQELVQIAQNTVHDLNHPLSAMRLILSSVEQGILGEVPDRVRDGIDNALLAARQMERMLDDLMDSSRLDFDGVELNFTDCDMALLVADIVRGLRIDICEKDVGIRIEPLPTIQCDEWALTKAFTNLISNAIKYGHPERRPIVTISCVREEERHVFFVADNGMGIPEDDQRRLFCRFERGSNTSGIGGTGLGLHIVKEAVRGHGGEVWVESVEGHGTRFCLAIPLEPRMPKHTTVSETAELADL